MESIRHLARPLFPLCLVLCAGCSGAARKYDRGYVSKGIEERTGHPLGPAREVAIDEAGKVSAAGDAPRFPPTVDLTDGLSSGEAVEIALWRNADLAAGLEDLGIARADLLQAGLLRNPTFEVLFPVGKKELEVTAGLPIELGGALFFRRKAAAIDLEAVAGKLIHSGIELAAQVKTAHAGVASADEGVRRAEEIAGILDRSAGLVEARERAGDASVQEARLARLEAISALQEVRRRRRDLALAREKLDLLLGLEPDPPAWTIARAPAAAAASPVLPAEALVSYALEHRLDALAAELEARAAAERIGLAWSGLLPVIAPLLNVKKPPGEGIQVGPGLSGDIPVLDWNQGGISRAEAQCLQAARRCLAVRDAVAAEVRGAVAALSAERVMVDSFRDEAIPRAETASRLALRAHQLGEESLLFSLEVQRKLAEARLGETEASLRLREAEISLERSLGGRLPPPGWSPSPRADEGSGGT